MSSISIWRQTNEFHLMKVGCSGSDTESGGRMHNKQRRMTETQREREREEERWQGMRKSDGPSNKNPNQRWRLHNQNSEVCHLKWRRSAGFKGRRGKFVGKLNFLSHWLNDSRHFVLLLLQQQVKPAVKRPWPRPHVDEKTSAQFKCGEDC